MIEIKYNALSRSKTIDLKNLIGRRVIAKSGDEIGKIKSLHINPFSLKVEGITVNKGLVENDYIGKDYIKSINQEGAVLKITPLTEYLDKEVIDAAGKKIGSVKEIKRSKKTNNIVSILVYRGILKQDLIIPKRLISSINDKVALKSNVAL